MLQITDRLILSPTDLVGFLACGHRTRLEWEAAQGLRTQAFDGDPVLDLVSRKGAEHEKHYLAELRASGLLVVDLSNLGNKSVAESEAAEAATVTAMRDGVDIVYQGVFFDGRWRGRPDFLRKLPIPSALGDWNYEAIDTKLARDVKAGAIVQLVLYSMRLGELQGRVPDHMHVITGANEPRAFRVDDYAAYVRTVRERFEAQISEPDPLANSYPHPVEHCRVCNWVAVCGERRRTDDHTSLVAGMTRTVTRKLVDAKLTTTAALGAASADLAIADLAQPTFDRLRAQASLQLQQRVDGVVRFELIDQAEVETLATVLTAEKTKSPMGLAVLPLPTEDDLFFDIEADPWAGEAGEGIEYLFGLASRRGGEVRYEALWAHSAEQEKALLEAFIDRCVAARKANPGFHVYHYGAYENSALKRLVNRYGTRDLDLAWLNRAEVFVDLYGVVRQGIRISQDSYSLKKIEALYMPHREGPITKGGFSVVEYEQWLDDQDQAHLDSLAAYNQDDCVSTLLLRDWLEARRSEAERRAGDPMPRPELKEGDAPEATAAEIAASQVRFDKLRAGLSADETLRDAAANARWRLSLLLDFHRREALPEWWRHFDLKKKSSIELVAETDAIGELTFERTVGTVKSSNIFRYRFDPDQDQKFEAGKKVLDPATGDEAGSIHAIDPGEGSIDLKRGKASAAPHPRALIPAKPMGTAPLEKALARLADDVIERGMEVDHGSWLAARRLLLHETPRIEGHARGAAIRRDGETFADAAVRSIIGLRDSYLPIQGPPGTGKTWTAAKAVLALFQAGKCVGLTGPSHKVIGNLIKAVLDEASRTGTTLTIVQRADEGEEVLDPSVERAKNTAGVASALSAGTRITAGTAWLYASDALANSHDVLFIDEAGQFSLANACAASGAASSMVLIGDPNQLPQVTKGSHPEGAGLSALGHVLGDAPTLGVEQGVFLGRTHRLHPDLCALISDSFYEGKLDSDPKTALVRINGSGTLSGTGLRLRPVSHEHCASRSFQEVDAVIDLMRDLLARTWVDRKGVERALTPQDILVVAPFNAQVGAIRDRVKKALGIDARVGTVDKFQGQEGAVVIYSMTSSSAEDAPRDLEFLYSPNRLNVSISRAQALAVLVYNEALLQAQCRTPEQMKLVNALCRIVEPRAARVR
ncbi:MAG: TM0106 family RecB-like putative nuclease [Vicinamibacteria bacterium]